jgi:LysM repeat protein
VRPPRRLPALVRSAGAAGRVAACLTLALAGCRGGHEETPTPTPDDRFVIVTPTPGTPVPLTPTPSSGPRSYTVQPGDTLSTIAAKFGVTQEAIQRANNLDDPNSIYAGQVLVIPEK